MLPGPLRGALAGVLLGAGLVVAAVAGLGGLASSPGGAMPDVQAQALALPSPAATTSPRTAAVDVAQAGRATGAAATEAEAEVTPEVEPEPEPTPAPEPEQADNAELRSRLAALLDDERLAGADLALHVLDEHERDVFGHRAEQPLLPASTAKLVTAAATLAQFGPAHRFTTTVNATAPPGADGVVHGDLVLVGGADPALATPAFGAQVNTQRPRTPLEALAEQVRAAGVRGVTGRIVGDPSVLPHEPVAAGWLDRYLARGDATRSSGLTVDAGRRLFVADGALRSAPADDPASEAAASLTTLLVDLEVGVAGPPGATYEPPAAAHRLAEVHSPPLIELLTHTVQRSDNHLADTLFRALGGALGDGSWAGSAQAAQRVLAPLELDWGQAVLADGSGLSRQSMLTARFLTTLDARMHASTRAGEWREVMAVAGRSGTLRRRFLGTVAEGRLAGKTGTLRDTRTLAGTVYGPDGTRYHFALLTGGLAGEARAAARELQDEVAQALAEDLYGCVRVPVVEATPSPASEPPAEPRTELRCAA